jgi:hypothetical protein
VQRAFISSVQRDFDEFRAAAKSAVESLGLQAVMAEATGASPDASRTALLGRLDGCDVLVLILGARYGYVAESGRSPTEEEFDRAVEEGIPVLAFVQEDVEREPAQETFLQRVRGTWETGVFAPGFHTPTELGFAIVRSLRQMEEGAADADALPAARQRAADLAGSSSTRGYASGSAMRVVFVPVGTSTLLDAAALDEPGLGDRIASIARAHGLVAQATGIEVAIRADAITAIGKGNRGSSDTTIILLPDGAVCVEADVRADGMLGGSAIAHGKVESLVEGASRVAQDLWAFADTGGRIRQVVGVLGVPDASMKVYAVSEIGSSMSMPMSTPSPIVAPEPPIVMRRNDVGAGETVRQLVAALKRIFSDHGAIHDR